MGQSFGHIFLVSTLLVGCCLIPAVFLPRKPMDKSVDKSVEPAAAMAG
jgi:hypothetical protein